MSIFSSIPKPVLIGGAVVAGIAGIMILRNSGASQQSASAGGYPLVMGSGASTGSSSSDQLSSVLASQMAMATTAQQTQAANNQAQLDLANAGYKSALDLANVGLQNTKTTILGSVWTSLFGSGSGSLNIQAPSFSQSNINSIDKSISNSTNLLFGTGGSATTKNTSDSAITSMLSNLGYTQGSIYGTVGFDNNGNIAVNVNRNTASSYTPIVGNSATQSTNPVANAANVVKSVTG
jgi:hypothetical protein